MKLQIYFLLFASILSLTNCKTIINILGLIPYNSGLSSYRLTNLAVSEINAREDILLDYTLNVIWEDSHCNRAHSISHFFDNDPGNFVSVFGLPCIGPAIAISEIISLYHPIMFTHSAFIPDDSYYSFIVNGFPTGINTVSAQLKFIKDHNWKRVATINYESVFFSDLGYELQRGFYRLNITNSVHSVSSTLYISEYETQIDNLIRTIDSDGFRVIVFNMFQQEAEYVLCRMQNLSINFDKYTLILPGFIYYEFNNNTNTSECNLHEVATGALGFIEHPRVEDILRMNLSTINGDNPSEIAHLIPDNYDGLYEVLGPFMYDSMWALAFAMNETINAGYIPHYDYYFSEELYYNLLNQSFNSITGHVQYNRKLRVSQYAQLVEFTPNGSEFRGLYSNLPYDIAQIGNLSGITHTNNISFKYWDETRTDGVEERNSSYYIFYIIVISSALGLVYIAILTSIISFGLYKHYPPAIKSEPAMSIFILTSSTLWLVLAVLLTIDGKFFPIKENVTACTFYCHLLIWLGSISTSLILGGVLAKSLKLYSFWVLNKFQKNYQRFLRFRYLVLIPISLVLIDTLVISFWAGFSPIGYLTQIVRSNQKDPPFYRIAFCQFNVNIPLGVLISFKVLVIFISIFLAYHLRKVTNKSQRYTFVISLVVYSTLFFSLFIIFIIGYVSNLDSKIGLASAFCILAAISNTTIIGLPIIYYMYRDPHGKTLFNPQTCDQFPEDSVLLRRRIQALQDDIELLKVEREEKLPKKKKSAVFVNSDTLANNVEEKN
ncbi:hypothetical protein LOD99_7792 [Oopsacas minuta]|uniref:G-protein coupled receptors family 3 profile domain-containing protein n=1 Tax=Oopsacas minuta TaxID=111878 RepID=A0AAV7JQW4_9METZ|nr:hypothetical protein LOD99_7792 [Oopsacas minuta]